MNSSRSPESMARMRAFRAAPVPVADRFWRYVDKNGPVHPTLGTRCWVWIGATNDLGYGQIHNGQKVVYAHRLSWEFQNGSLATGQCVLHRCDNPPCVNPEHHFTGTKKQNSEDMTAKGRCRLQGRHAPECKRGHPMTPDNIVVNSARHPSHRCRICLKEWRRQRRNAA